MSKICSALPADRLKADPLFRGVPEDEDDEEEQGEDDGEEGDEDEEDDEGEGYSE
jgi:hypothetical protein